MVAKTHPFAIVLDRLCKLAPRNGRSGRALVHSVTYAVALGLLLWSFATLPAKAAQVRMRFMGQLSCGAWPDAEPYNSADKAMFLNWVLGYLSHASKSRGVDLLAKVDQPSVSAWMDRYCSEHPLDDIPTAAGRLETELVMRSQAGN